MRLHTSSRASRIGSFGSISTMFSCSFVRARGLAQKHRGTESLDLRWEP